MSKSSHPILNSLYWDLCIGLKFYYNEALSWTEVISISTSLKKKNKKKDTSIKHGNSQNRQSAICLPLHLPSLFQQHLRSPLIDFCYQYDNETQPKKAKTKSRYVNSPNQIIQSTNTFIIINNFP